MNNYEIQEIITMTEFQIFTDSCCDLLAAQTAEMNVVCVPLTVVMGDTATDDYATAAERKAFFDSIRSGAMPSTSAVNPDRWLGEFQTALENGKDVLAICFASALSTTYQSAVIAAEELKERFPDRTILVCDTLSASAGQGLLVTKACQMRDAGKSIQEVFAWLEENKAGCCHWITVDDLSHLKRGGRLSATSAIVGTMLAIKPMLYIDGAGKLLAGAKVRGRKAALEALAAKAGESTDKENIYLFHADCLADAEKCAAIMKEKYGVKNVHISHVGGVVGSHVGPGGLVLGYLGANR